MGGDVFLTVEELRRILALLAQLAQQSEVSE